jgi:hypothetical protein
MFVTTGLFLTAVLQLISATNTNINGTYLVKQGWHYPNKTSVTWGENNETTFKISLSLSHSCAVYNCSSSCSDEYWYDDFNKIWGKARYV